MHCAVAPGGGAEADSGRCTHCPFELTYELRSQLAAGCGTAPRPFGAGAGAADIGGSVVPAAGSGAAGAAIVVGALLGSGPPEVFAEGVQPARAIAAAPPTNQPAMRSV
ncbi:hypothetical protein [Nocardia terpenica]|uniref:hypothetical protein n=1 Tax=Nocardia terpenica TaxID=455432 RepID=UPI00397EE64C